MASDRSGAGEQQDMEEVMEADAEAAYADDDPRAGIELYPAANNVEDGDPDDYVLRVVTTEGTTRYRLSYDQGGHMLQLVMNAFRRAGTRERGIQ